MRWTYTRQDDDPRSTLFRWIQVSAEGDTIKCWEGNLLVGRHRARWTLPHMANTVSFGDRASYTGLSDYASSPQILGNTQLTKFVFARKRGIPAITERGTEYIRPQNAKEIII